jgi:arylsulfatase A-like enzyme
LFLAGCVVLQPSGDAKARAEPPRPNVLIIITDDQGHGDLGIHGNPVIKTPNFDRLGRSSVRLTNFYVSPVCAPTRSSLLTGRYNYRTGVVDTFQGRAMMRSEEVTLAERLASAGYRTGIFGKWHLGDNAPMRPMDQGFRESLVLKGGGIGQPSDPPGGTHYFDPILQHNGKPETRPGYCSDIFTTAAIEFMTAERERPVFTYLAFNCPHTPLEVPESDLAKYAQADLSNTRFPTVGRSIPAPTPRDETARVYGMISNIDDNIGRLFQKMEQAELAENTLVIFLTDNGPQQVRYVSGLRGRKGTVYEGGIRVPCFLRWPGVLKPGEEIDRIAAHIDLTPTVLEACGIAKLDNVSFDGVSLWPLLTGKVAAADWPDRTLFFQWHRGNIPERFRAFAARSQRFKLVRAEGPGSPPKPAFELFDIPADPYEQHNIASEHPEAVEKLRTAYSAWFDDVGRPFGYAAPRIWIGSTEEDPVSLTRQDWRVPPGDKPGAYGHWEVDVKQTGRYRVRVRLNPGHPAGRVTVSMGGSEASKAVESGEDMFELAPLSPSQGPTAVEARLVHPGGTLGVWSLDVSRAE